MVSCLGRARRYRQILGDTVGEYAPPDGRRALQSANVSGSGRLQLATVARSAG